MRPLESVREVDAAFTCRVAALGRKWGHEAKWRTEKSRRAISAGCSGPGGREVLPSSARRRLLKLCERRLEPPVTRGQWGTERTVSEAKGLGGPAGRQEARRVWKLTWTTSSSGPTSESCLRPPWTLPRLVGKMPRAPALPPACSGARPPGADGGRVAARGGGAGVREALARKPCRPAPGRAGG